jgi:cobaltochelatase CobN
MHLLRTEGRTIEEAEAAVDLGQSPGDIVILSFSDSDLGALAAASMHRDGSSSLRLASLAQLKHPYSVDLYLDRVVAKARFVLVRLLGGLDYWRYGVEECARIARVHGVALAIVPGDHREDARLDAASTLPVAALRRLWAYFQNGGSGNMGSLYGWIATHLGEPAPWSEPQPVPPAGRYVAACRTVAAAKGHAVITFYRSMVLAGDCAPIVALADALAARGLDVTALYATSLKDPQAATILAAAIAAKAPDVIVNTTAFSGRGDGDASVLDRADAPVLQAILAGASEDQWRANPRGLGPADLAMNVVLPEMDGRLITAAISCKAESPRSDTLEFSRLVHRPIASRVAFVADLAAHWVRLRKTPAAERRIAMVLSDYPGKLGREAYAVGLDTPASVTAMTEDLRAAGYAIGRLQPAERLMDVLKGAVPSRHHRSQAGDERAPALSVEDYRHLLTKLPDDFVAGLIQHWGDPAADSTIADGAFVFRLIQAGNLTLALQPDRGHRADRTGDYHDTAMPPRHAYVAFYLWLRHRADIHALVHCGTHGTLEWLPGKPVALDTSCAPEALLGPIPLIYPFIVNNPGEAAQAKRRNAAITIGHMTPPLVEAGLHGAAIELEALFDEYAAAETLDPKRARIIGRTLLERAADTGLATESGLNLAAGESALVALDAWLCDIKEMRIRDGLHTFGRGHDGDSTLCAAGERAGLLAALDGRFVPGGPSGAPSRGRMDVLPTGRNLYGTDPRAVPSRTATEIGRRAADAVAERHAQDHGDWPRAIVLDLWASATMRTGGEDLAQAMAHLGVRPTWDHASARVSGFEILPFARLERPRVDVTLRISGLFRDIFPAQITLFDQAVKAVAALDEDASINPLAAARRAGESEPRRIFGAGPSLYGIGLGHAIDADSMAARDDLGRAYLAAGSHAYGGAAAEGLRVAGAFEQRVAAADAFVHVQDMADLDVLDAQANVEAEAGFAAAAHALGTAPALYHLDAGATDALVVRSQAEEITRVVRGRAANPRWIAGQMRHGHRGAAEIAETVDNLYAMAVMSDSVASLHFDLMFAATCGTPAVRAFLLDANRDAARAIAERFRDAATRGLWSSRRNSDAATLADMLESAA